MTPALARLYQFAADIFRPVPKIEPAKWVSDNIRIPPPYNKIADRIDLRMTPYVREFINECVNPANKEITACWGAQTCKTTAVCGVISWFLVMEPCAVGWMMPSITAAESFSKERWVPMVMASPALKEKAVITKTAFTNSSQRFEAAQLNFIGSNSAVNTSSRPLKVGIQDELDKAGEGTSKEGSSDDLFSSRIAASDDGKLIRTSTPSTAEGFIWRHFLAGDQRRLHCPCPHCAKPVNFVFSKKDTQLTITGNEAELKWDEKAKNEDGSWDMDRVEASAYMECPHCLGQIKTHHKTKMLRESVWIATNPNGGRGKISFHLSSFYAPWASRAFGSIAKEFLTKKANKDLHGFVNETLAEPYVSQDGEVSARHCADITPELPAGWWHQITVDIQKDHEWAAVVRWDRDGNSQTVLAQKIFGDGDIMELQSRFCVPDHLVCLDSGNNATDVYRRCLAHGKQVPIRGRALPLHVGWTPVKGEPRQYFLNPLTKGRTAYRLIYIDPFIGDQTGMQNKVQIPLLEVATYGVKDELDELRHGKKAVKFEISSLVDQAVFWKHMDGERPVYETNGRGKQWKVWKPKSKGWPNHLLDCMVYQIALHRHQVDLPAPTVSAPPAARQTAAVGR
jgi:phage terminase large subunit GpA-like protein